MTSPDMTYADSGGLEATASAPPLRWNSERKSELLAGLGGLRPYGSTGLVELDHLLGGGLLPGVHILSALPGAGKSSLALMVADHMARFGNGRVIYLSLEMSSSSLTAKSLTRLSTEGADEPLTFSEIVSILRHPESVGSPRFDVLNRTLETYFREVAPSLATVDVAMTIEQLAKLYDSFPSTERKPAAIVDYLQLVPRSEREAALSDYQSLTAVMRELCILAQRHSVPILGISSQNRGTKRGGASLELLSGSSALEFGASSVMFLTIDGDDDEQRQRNAERDMRPVTLRILKNRYGRLGSVPMYFHPATSRFIERVEES